MNNEFKTLEQEAQLALVQKVLAVLSGQTLGSALQILNYAAGHVNEAGKKLVVETVYTHAPQLTLVK